MASIPERRKDDHLVAALDRKVRRLAISSYVKYVLMLVLLVFVVIKLSDRQERTDRVAVVAAAAARVAKAAAANTRALALQNTENARAAARLAQDLSRAVCAWRADLQRRVDTTEDFLRTNPKGFPGVPLKTITDGLANQKRTIRAFKALVCEPSTP